MLVTHVFAIVLQNVAKRAEDDGFSDTFLPVLNVYGHITTTSSFLKGFRHVFRNNMQEVLISAR